MPPQDTIEWQAHEYAHRERSRDWFFALYVIVLGLIVASVLFRNYLFAVFIGLAAFTVVLRARRTPEVLSYTISRSGVLEHNSLYPYSYLKCFWFDETVPDDPRLLIQSQKALSPLLVMPIDPSLVERARTMLSNYIPERELHEPLLHKILENLGF